MAPIDNKKITADYWSANVAGSKAFSPEVYWLAVPHVQRRFKTRATAGLNYASWVQYCLAEFLKSSSPAERMLSLGCGSGTLERELLRSNAFEHCDAFDIAPGAIEIATREARAMGDRSIQYSVADIEQIDLPCNHYDAVWFNGSLHHIRALESVLERARDALKPGGWLFLNEYVGANYFGFDQQQRTAIEHTFRLIPEPYRHSFSEGSKGSVQATVLMPDPLEVARVDPSEAVRSADILETVRRYFDIETINACGGSLLQFVLHGVAGNFREDDPSSIAILEMLFDIEDALINSGTLKSDFVVVAARPKRMSGISGGVVHHGSSVQHKGQRLSVHTQRDVEQAAPQELEAACRIAMTTAPDGYAAWLSLAWHRYEQGELNGAIVAATQAGQGPYDEKPYLDSRCALIWFLMESGSITDAQTVAMDTLAIAPHHAVLRWHLGMLFFRKGDLAEAATNLFQAVSLDPSLDEAAALLAWVLHDQGQLLEATIWVRRALGLHANAERKAQLGWLLLLQNDAAAAIPHFQESIAEAPQTVTTRVHLARALVEQHRQKEALEVLQQGLLRTPDSQPLLLATARLHFDLHETQKASEVLTNTLSHDPKCAEAWYLSGVVENLAERYDVAAAQLTRALDLDASLADGACRLALHLRTHHRSEEAMVRVTAALRHHPKNVALRAMHVQLLLDVGNAPTARRHIHTLLSQEPHNERYWLLLAHALQKCQRAKSASMAVRRALRLRPDHADAWSLAAWLALEDNRLADARSSLGQLMRLTPDTQSTHIQAAFILATCGELADAAKHAESAVDRQPESAEAWRALGFVRQRQGHLKEAESSLVYALSLNPQPPTDCLRQLGWIRRSDGRFAEAAIQFQLAAEVAPDNTTALYELAETVALDGWPLKARCIIEQILARRPSWQQALLLHARLLHDGSTSEERTQAVSLCARLLREHKGLEGASSVLMAMAALGNRDARRELRLLARPERLHGYRTNLENAQAKGSQAAFSGLAHLARNDFPDDLQIGTTALYALFLDGRTTAPELAPTIRSWSRRLSMQAGLNKAATYPGQRDKTRLRIAYVASHFHHSLLMPVLASHASRDVEVFLYCDIAEDSLGQLVRPVILQPLRGQDLAISMRANRIDVAIDTVGVGAFLGQDSVLLQFAQRIAPIQCAWLGSWAGSGGIFDYVISDEQALPQGSDHLYQEGTIRIPGGQWSWKPPRHAPQVGLAPCISHRRITLGCAVRAFRISSGTLRAWARLLARLPDAQFILLGEHGQNRPFRADLEAALKLEGVAPNRVSFRQQRSYADYLEVYGDIDIALDSFPANGGLCLLDALWMGVPFVTLAGTWLGERQGLSILASVGHPEWAATDEEQYVSIVCLLASAPEALAGIRKRLRREVSSSALMQGDRVATAIESACLRLKHQSLEIAQAPSPKERIRAVARRQLEIWFDKGGQLDFLPRPACASDRPDVSVVVVLFKQAGLARQTLSALADQTGICFETIVVDNASGEETERLTQRLHGVHLECNVENIGFLRAANQGAALARGRHILFLNSDAILHEGALGHAVRRLDDDASIGAVGGRIVLADGTLQEAGCIAYRTGSTSGYGRGRDPKASEFCFIRDVDFCSGAFLMIRHALWQQLGGFDDAYAPAYYEDTDLCLRIQDAGYRVVYDPSIWLTHFEWASAESSKQAVDLMVKNSDRFATRHKARLAQRPDPTQAKPYSDRWLARRKTRILIIDNAVPHMAVGGGLPRARLILQALADNDVTLFPLWTIDEDWREVYASIPQSIEVILGVGAAGLEPFLADHADVYDFLMVSRPPNMAFINTLWARRPELFRGMRLVYDAEAVFSMREIGQAAIQGRPLSYEKAQHMLNEELALVERAEVVLSVSINETRLFQAAGARRVCLLSHSMVTRRDTPGWRERENLLFVGALHPNTPNEDGLLWFCTDVMPQLEIRHGLALVLDVVGDCFSQRVAALASRQIRILGRVDDLTHDYDGHRVFVAPTRFAAGVPAKVIEAACNGIPVVATKLLANQLGWVAGQEILAEDDAQAFADALAALYRDERLWNDLRSRMLERAQQDFAPEPFHQTLHGIFARPSPHTEFYS